MSTSRGYEGVDGGGRPYGGSRSYDERPQRHWASGRRHDAALSASKRVSAIAKCRDTRTGSFSGSFEQISIYEPSEIASERFLERTSEKAKPKRIKEDCNVAPKLALLDFLGDKIDPAGKMIVVIVHRRTRCP